MKNIIISGDSFCSDASGWPSALAQILDRRLICYTEGSGQSWWAAREWLVGLDLEELAACDIMIFLHTNADRIPTANTMIGRVDHSATPESELELAIKAYHRHIHDPAFLRWAQQSWFKEISEVYSQKYLVHLHCFPWTLEYRNHLHGLNVITNLTALSLNEIGAARFSLYHDDRSNHLNQHNNHALANQLAEFIKQRIVGDYALDHRQFQQKTLEWLTRKNWSL